MNRDHELEDLVGLAEMAQGFGVPYSTALSWTRTRGFPAPVKVFKMGPAWSRNEVAEYRRQKEKK
jgi:predicted DNA-binding transcriptional regulator AlpA